MALVLCACEPVEQGLEENRFAEAGGTVETGRLEPGASLERSIAPGETHSYDFGLTAGDFIELAVEQVGVDVVLRLFDPEGRKLLEADLPIADRGSEGLFAVVERDGVHKAEVEAWESESPEGRYVARVSIGRAGERERTLSAANRSFHRAEELSWDRKFDDSIELYREARELWAAAGDDYWQAVALARLGSAFRSVGERQAALEVREEAAALFGSVGEKTFEAITQFDIGYLYFELGMMEPAIDRYRQSLALREQLGDERGKAPTLGFLAEVYKVQGKPQLALDHYAQALELLDHPETRRDRATALHNLGTLYRQMGRLDLAMEHVREAEQIYEELEAHRFQAASLSQMGQLHLEQGETASALDFLTRAVELRRQIGNPRGEAAALRNLGSVHVALGELERGRQHYKQAEALLAGLDSPRSMASVLADLGSLHQQTGADEQALDYYARALALFEEIGDPFGQVRTLLGAAVSKRREGDLPGALEAAEKALELAEGLRLKPLSESLRLAFFATVQTLFDLYIEVLMDMHRVDGDAGHAAAAFDVSERARARLLLDLLGEATAEVREGAAPDLLAREKALQRRLEAGVERTEDEFASERQRASAAAEVRAAIEELDSLRATIRRESPRYAELTQPTPLDLAAIQRDVLDPHTALLQYRLAPERSYLWLVTKERLEAFELPPREEIEASARRAHRLLRRSHRREAQVQIRSLLCELGRQLLEPLAGKLDGKRLAIAADGALHLLPFAALPDPDSSVDCLEVEPLVAGHQIVSLPSASTLAVVRGERRRRRPPSGLIAVVADPVYEANDPRVTTQARGLDGADPQSWSGQVTRSPRPDATRSAFRRLEHSRQEAHSILELVSPQQGSLALGFEASKEAVLAGRLAEHRVVHFGTHGVLNPEEPALSGIVLSQVDRRGEAVDGFLRAHEIFNLDLKADLVVLGACETALGREVGGEGILGLARGFMYAGASQVMVSLWKVADRSTAELMTAFYRDLLVQGATPAAALRAAQLELRTRSPEPFHWAGFVLQGEWRSGVVD